MCSEKRGNSIEITKINENLFFVDELINNAKTCIVRFYDSLVDENTELNVLVLEWKIFHNDESAGEIPIV